MRNISFSSQQGLGRACKKKVEGKFFTNFEEGRNAIKIFYKKGTILLGLQALTWLKEEKMREKLEPFFYALFNCDAKKNIRLEKETQKYLLKKYC